MKSIRLKTLKKAIKDAENRGVTTLYITDNSGNICKIRCTLVSSITGIQIILK
jgi:hypothetical protein